MSMDGVDVAMAQITGTLPNISIQLIDGAEYPYPEALRLRLLAAREGASAEEACQLNMWVGQAFAEIALRFLQERAIEPDAIDAIGSHGQTLVHLPPGAEEVASTLQLGPPSVVAELTGIPTVGNFRPRDMARGGQGAPLIPLLDHVLFRSEHAPVAVNNLGSISNVTVVTPVLDEQMGFDTGPANMAIDHYSRLMTGNDLAIDRDGHLSASGRVNEALLLEMLDLPFFSTRPPKSAGYGDFGPAVLNALASRHPTCNGADLVRTAVHFTVHTMADAYRRFVFPRWPALKQIILTGGGAFHPGVISGLQSSLPAHQIKSLALDDPALNSAKEALGMALLAHQYFTGAAGNLPAVTGANTASVLGELAL